MTAVLLLALAAACGGGGSDDSEPAGPANEAVRTRLERLAPANLGHRGTGPTRPLGRFPENSLNAFRAAIRAGADGVELDVVLTADRQLLVLHDDTLDRTTSCRGCANTFTLAEAQACFLRDGTGSVTDQRPPSLAEAYAALPRQALVNVELKVFGDPCVDPRTGPVPLARTAVAKVQELRAASRTIFSSFNEVAVAAIKQTDPTLYAALLSGAPQAGLIERVTGLGLDAVHPSFSGVSGEFVAAAHAAALQVNVYTVNGRRFLMEALDLGVDAIITDDPELLHQLREEGS
jgi:glycerophosphoryl diester phosphodiesterase